ncbi:MAG: DUF6145 family protein [Lachnospiraceae bacterium]|nr:DUF6145 family protein [Lachnospiraceae bacterium]
MDIEGRVLAAASAYEQKYYLNPAFESLPQTVKDEIQVMCVLFTEEVGGVFSVEYDEEGNLGLVTMADENDLLYDDIGSNLKIKQLRKEKRELFDQLEKYYKVKYLGEELTDDSGY